MATFIVEQYEVCTTTYEVTGVETPAAAVLEVLQGRGEIINVHEYIEVDELRGMPAESDQDVADAIENKLGWSLAQGYIPSIRRVRKVKRDKPKKTFSKKDTND